MMALHLRDLAFQDKLHGTWKYCPAYVESSKNLYASFFTDHASSDMHQQAVLLVKKSQSSDVTDYVLITKTLDTLDANS